MNTTYPDTDDDEEDYFRSLDALLSTQQALKSVLVGNNSGGQSQSLLQYAPPQPAPVPAARQPLLLDRDGESGSDDDFRGHAGGGGRAGADEDDEYEPSSEPESEAASDDLAVAEAAARGVLDAEADIAQLAAEGGVAYGSARDGDEPGSDAEAEAAGAAGEWGDVGGGEGGDDGGSASGSDEDGVDLDSYIVRSPGEFLPPGTRLERLYAALDTNRELQRQLCLMLERLDSHSNSSYLLERRVREQRAVTKPRSAEERATLLARAAVQAAAAAGAPLPPGQPLQTSRFWRVAGVTPAPSREWTRLAAAQQLPLRPYDRVRWPQRVVDALNKGLTLEVQAILTKQLLDRIQQLQQQQGQQPWQRQQHGGPGAAAEAAAGGSAGGAATASPAGGGAGAAAAGPSGGSGTVPTNMQTLQEQLKRIAAVRPDSAEAIPVILRLDDEAWVRVATSHRVGRSGAECAAYYRHNLRPGLQWPLEESRRLMELAEKYGKRHWDKVAADLGTGRTPGQCLAHCLRWSRFDRRPIRGVWSAQDDEALKALVAKYGKDWVAVAEEFGGRFDRHQVRDRWHGVMTAGGPRRVGKWTREEDAQLTKAVDDLGQKWTEVARHVAGRTARQCRERYVNLLSPGLKFGPFSEEEQRVLAEACGELQAAYGRIIWSRVAERLPGRTDDQCSRAYEGMVKHAKAHIGHKRGGANHQLRTAAQPGAATATKRKRRDAEDADDDGDGGGNGGGDGEVVQGREQAAEGGREEAEEGRRRAAAAAAAEEEEAAGAAVEGRGGRGRQRGRAGGSRPVRGRARRAAAGEAAGRSGQDGEEQADLAGEEAVAAAAAAGLLPKRGRAVRRRRGGRPGAAAATAAAAEAATAEEDGQLQPAPVAARGRSRQQPARRRRRRPQSWEEEETSTEDEGVVGTEAVARRDQKTTTDEEEVEDEDEEEEEEEACGGAGGAAAGGKQEGEGVEPPPSQPPHQPQQRRRRRGQGCQLGD